MNTQRQQLLGHASSGSSSTGHEQLYLEIFAVLRSILLNYVRFYSILSSIIWTKLGASDALGDVGRLARRTRIVSIRQLETNRQQWDVDSWRSCEIHEHAPSTAPWTRVVGKLVNRPRASIPRNFRSDSLDLAQFCLILLDFVLHYMDKVGRVGRIGRRGEFSKTYTHRQHQAPGDQPIAMGRRLVAKLRGP